MILHVQLFENGKSLLLIPFDPGVKQFVRIKLLHAVLSGSQTRLRKCKKAIPEMFLRRCGAIIWIRSIVF